MRWIIVGGPHGDSLAIEIRRHSSTRGLFWWLVASPATSAAALATNEWLAGMAPAEGTMLDESKGV